MGSLLLGRLSAFACASATTLAVAATPTTLTIRSTSPDPSEFGQGVVVFTELDAEAGVPTGSISVSDENGGCSFTLPQTYCLYIPSTAGQHSLTAQYSGDVDFESSQSAAVMHEAAEQGYPRRVSMGSVPAFLLAPASAGTGGPSLSVDGRYALFDSSASNLVPAAKGGTSGIYRKDASTQLIERIDIASDGTPGNGSSNHSSMSADHRYVVFESTASNLVPGDTNGVADIFVRDTIAGTLVRVSVSSDGVQGNGASKWPSISADGRFVAFKSSASNLVAGDSNFAPDAFVHDLATGATERVDLSTTGAQVSLGSSVDTPPSISGDGRYVAFDSYANNLVPGDTNNTDDVFVRDRIAGTTTRVSVDASDTQANNSSGDPRLTPNGRFVSFTSAASNLVADDTNGVADVFVKDLVTGAVDRISVASDGSQGLALSNYAVISDDGQRVAFTSTSSNLDPSQPSSFSGVFLHDRATGLTHRVSIDSSGMGANGASTYSSISGDGRKVAFASLATNLSPGDLNGVVDAFVHDVDSGTTEALATVAYGNQADGPSDLGLSISADGRFVAFASSADNLVMDDHNGVEDVFVRDIELGTTERVSVDSEGHEANAACSAPQMTPDGRYIVFQSEASNLVDDDTNATTDVFVHDRLTGQTVRASVSDTGVEGNDFSAGPVISANGRFVAFNSNARNLVPGATDFAGLVVHDMQTGTNVRASVSSAGAPAGTNLSFPGSFSADGRYLSFASAADNLVPGDTNHLQDTFVRDLQAGVTTRVSVATGGGQGDGFSSAGTLSADGSIVAFTSSSSNLVPGDTGGYGDVFVRDLQAGTTTRISVNADGTQGNNYSYGAALSANGRYTLFGSQATNLVEGDGNGVADIFVRDLQTNAIARVSVARDGMQQNAAASSYAISADGHSIAFGSSADNLVDGDTNRYADTFLTLNPLAFSPTQLVIASITPASTVVGQPYTVSVQLTGDDGSPRGSVSISDGAGAGCVAALDAGVGACEFASIQGGNLNLVATYAGEAGYGPSTVTASHLVGAAATSTSLQLPGERVSVGESAAYVAHVSVLAPGDGSPSGSIQLLDGGTPVASADLADGTAVIALTEMSAGTHDLSARYVGDARFAASESGATPQDVQPAATTTTLIGVSPESPSTHERVTVSFEVDGLGLPTGLVTISADSGETCSADVGTGACTLSFTAPGIHVLTARYPGDGNNQASVSPPSNIVVEATVDLSVTVSDDRTFVQGGAVTGYAVVVSNRGPDAAEGARVQAALPANLSGVSWTCAPVAPATCSSEGAGTLDDTVSIPASGSLTYLLAGTVVGVPEYDLIVNATVTAPPDAHETATEDNSAQDTDRVVLYQDGFDDPL